MFVIGVYESTTYRSSVNLSHVAIRRVQAKAPTFFKNTAHILTQHLPFFSGYVLYALPRPNHIDGVIRKAIKFYHVGVSYENFAIVDWYIWRNLDLFILGIALFGREVDYSHLLKGVGISQLIKR